SISSLLPQLAARSLQGGYRPFPASGLLTRRRLWRPLAMRGALLGHATFPPGSALCRDRRPPAADLGCSASPSAATNICAPCSHVRFQEVGRGFPVPRRRIVQAVG